MATPSNMYTGISYHLSHTYIYIYTRLLLMLICGDNYRPTKQENQTPATAFFIIPRGLPPILPNRSKRTVQGFPETLRYGGNATSFMLPSLWSLVTYLPCVKSLHVNIIYCIYIYYESLLVVIFIVTLLTTLYFALALSSISVWSLLSSAVMLCVNWFRAETSSRSLFSSAGRCAQMAMNSCALPPTTTTNQTHHITSHSITSDVSYHII